MDVLSRALNGVFDLLLAPCGASRWAGIAVVSVLSGVLLLWLFKLVTPQRRLARARGRLMGHLYELGLFQDDLRTILRVQRDFALANLRYLLTALPALVVLIPAVGLIVVQLEARYQHSPLQPGRTVLVGAELAPDSAGLLDRLEIETGEGLTLDAPPVRDRARGEIWWRLRATAPGGHEVTVAAPGTEGWTKRVGAGPDAEPFSLARGRPGSWTALANPVEDPLPSDSPLLRLSVVPSGEAPWYRRDWFWGFCLLSIIGGLAFKGLLRVEI